MNTPWTAYYPEGVNETISTDQYSSIANYMEASVDKYASNIAITCMDTDITYSEYNKFANNFAAYCQNKTDLSVGDRVAIMVPNVIQFPVAFFAAQKAGYVCVNTNPLYTARELRHQLKDSGAKAIVILDMFLDKLEEVIEDTNVETVIVTSIGDHLPFLKANLIKLVMKFKGLIPKTKLKFKTYKNVMEIGSRLNYSRVAISADDVALLQYTGGTTGVSKGAMLTHKNVLSNCMQILEWAKPFVSPGEETVLTALPLYHIFALTVNYLSFLGLGCRSILVPKPVPIENTVKIFKKYRITAMTGVNTLYNALNNNEEFKKLSPNTIKLALSGGMALQDSVNNAFKLITGTKILEGFGLTEASPVTHCNTLHIDLEPGSIGVPLPSTYSMVVDGDGNRLPYGDKGELIVKGPQVMKGYWGRKEATEETIREGWLFTGDIAVESEDGVFAIVDRMKDMIIVSGFNVYPNEVENVIACHDGVDEVAVIGESHPEKGEVVKAVIVLKDKSLTEAEIIEFCKRELTGYKVPKLVEFRDELPKTNVGKILRRALRSA